MKLTFAALALSFCLLGSGAVMGEGNHACAGCGSPRSYSNAPTSGSATLDRFVNYGNHSSPNFGREAGGYASGGSGTGGNY